MASPCLYKPPIASGPASHVKRVKPVTKQTFGRASPGAAREAAGKALPNGALEYVWQMSGSSKNGSGSGSSFSAEAASDLSLSFDHSKKFQQLVRTVANKWCDER